MTLYSAQPCVVKRSYAPHGSGSQDPRSLTEVLKVVMDTEGETGSTGDIDLIRFVKVRTSNYLLRVRIDDGRNDPVRP